MRHIGMAARGICLGVGLLLSGPCRAETVLFDFERPAELEAFHYEGVGRPVREIRLTDRWATNGTSALVFEVPKWKAGMAEWPAFEADMPARDWTGFDRLVLDVTNPTATRHLFALLVTDSKVTIRSGLSHTVRLEPSSLTRIAIPLAPMAGLGLNQADIRRIHFFTERPVGDLSLIADRITLLKPGERPAAVSGTYAAQYGALVQANITEATQVIASAAKQSRKAAARSNTLGRLVESRLAALGRELAALETLRRSGGTSVIEVPARTARLRQTADALARSTEVRARWERVEARVKMPAAPAAIVGFASSMVKVLPRAGMPDLVMSPAVQMGLARNEKEAIQLVVVPTAGAIRSVSVHTSDVRGPGGSRLAASSVEIAPVGYVRTRSVPPYGSSHVGWWPDPILTFLKSVDIAKGDAQAFWVRVRAPKAQRPGTYRGKLSVHCAGKPAYVFDFAVRVRSFAVPDRSPLPLAVTFWPEDNAIAETTADQTKWRTEPDYPVNAWKRHKVAWADMLADHYLTYDSLYPYKGWEPDFDILQRQRTRGQLGRFNLGYYGPCPDTAEGAAEWVRSTIDVIRPRYERAKHLDMLREAYIYGCDEAPSDLFGTVENAARRIREAFPGVEVMTTTYDHTFGLNSVIKSVDAFCPLTPSYDRTRADDARAAGKSVWWYICCGPHHPHANMFVEYPAIDGRILMRAQTARYRPDGFLYYQISIWNSHRPITKGPFTDWDPRSWTVYHGDGSWTCVGPGGTPLSTIRLENFRDGLEDYAYALELERIIKRVEASGAGVEAWLKQARSLLEAPGVVTSMTDFTKDPAVVMKWREAMADAIERAPGREGSRR